MPVFYIFKKAYAAFFGTSDQFGKKFIKWKKKGFFIL